VITENTDLATDTLIGVRPDMTAEERPVDGCPGYAVTSDGRVISYKYRRRLELRQGRIGRGYRSVKLWVSPKYRTRYVHQLVAIAFHGPRPPGMEVRHLDTDKSNNRVDNLAWGTPEENRADNHAFSRYRKGEAVTGHKLTEHDVRAIRQHLDDGMAAAAIARCFCVAHSQIWSIKSGTTWKHVI
jgi:hypothetical protein